MQVSHVHPPPAPESFVSRADGPQTGAWSRLSSVCVPECCRDCWGRELTGQAALRALGGSLLPDPGRVQHRCGQVQGGAREPLRPTPERGTERPHPPRGCPAGAGAARNPGWVLGFPERINFSYRSRNRRACGCWRGQSGSLRDRDGSHRWFTSQLPGAGPGWSQSQELNPGLPAPRASPSPPGARAELRTKARHADVGCRLQASDPCPSCSVKCRAPDSVDGTGGDTPGAQQGSQWGCEDVPLGSTGTAGTGHAVSTQGQPRALSSPLSGSAGLQDGPQHSQPCPPLRAPREPLPPQAAAAGAQGLVDGACWSRGSQRTSMTRQGLWLPPCSR